MLGQGQITDWTNGTGVFPAGGVISIPANTERQYICVQNRDVGEVLISVNALAANGSGYVEATLSINAANASGNGGGSEEMDILQFVAQSAIVISGTAGQKVTVLTA